MIFACSLCALQAHRNWVLCVSWSPDATMIATGDMNGDIWLWDAAAGQPLGQCKGHSKWITSLVRSLQQSTLGHFLFSEQ
jgi:ribosome assembly protein 4